MASFLNSGISKSKSEPLNLKSSTCNKKSKKQPKTIQKQISRPKSKSPRNSRVIPGVRITELKLKTKSSVEKEEVTLDSESNQYPKTPEGKTKMALPISSNHQMAISDIWKDESPNIAVKPNLEVDFNDRMTSLTMSQKDAQGLDTLEQDNIRFSSDEKNNSERKIINYVSSLEDTLTASRVFEIEANRIAHSVVASQSQDLNYMNGIYHQEQQPCSLASSICSTLSAIQPPSVMDSLISISGGAGEFSSLSSTLGQTTSLSTSATSSTSSTTVKESDKNNSNGLNSTTHANTRPLECRHTLSGKKGNFVPEMVRRGLGAAGGQTSNSFGANNVTIATSSSYYDDLTSSLSSCQSNLDNIKPPTIMDDNRFMDQMDNSILSIASISSEIAPIDIMEKSTGFGRYAGLEITNNTVDHKTNEIDKDKIIATYVTDLDTKAWDEEAVSEACCTALEDIAPPTLMEEVSGCTKTLVANRLENQDGRERNSDQTYTIQGSLSFVLRNLLCMIYLIYN